MSYPLHQVSGGSSARTVRSESGFWGLDLSSCVLDRSFARAMDTENLIWHGDALGVRPGYTKLETFSERINGFWFYGNQQIFHAGTNLFRKKNAQAEPELIFSEMNDAPSQGVMRFHTVVCRTCSTVYLDAWKRSYKSVNFLFINDGKNFIFYDGESVCSMEDSYWGENVKELIAGGSAPVYYATVPYTVVAKLPTSGIGDLDPKGDNRLSQFRCESFYVDDQQEVSRFALSALYSAYNAGVPPEIQVRGYDSVWRSCGIASSEVVHNRYPIAELEIFPLRAGMAFSCDEEGRISAFGTGDYKVANDGMDNLRITYAVIKDPPEALTGATVQCLYGADGADDTLFLGGSAVRPGEDAFSAQGNFFCFYETSTEQLGGSRTPVTGYCRLSDGRLAVLKDDPDGSAVFFRSHEVVSMGTTKSGEAYQVDVYPSRAGASVEGCVTPFSVGVAGNEPCFLSESGLYSVRSVSNELTNLNETVRRSVPVDPLLSTLPAEDARCICWKNYYLITFGNTAFITDGERDSDGYLRFLKWRFSHKITALGQKDDRLYLGDNDGNFYLFGDGTDDAGEPFSAFWHTPLLEDQNGRRLILRRMWAAVSPGYGCKASVQILRDRCPVKPKNILLHLLDFADWDFGAVSFEGNGTARWVALTDHSMAADAFSVIFDFSEALDLLLWGFRVVYEKGGMMK